MLGPTDGCVRSILIFQRVRWRLPAISCHFCRTLVRNAPPYRAHPPATL